MKDVNRRATRRDSDVKQLVYLRKKKIRFLLSNYLNIFVSISTKKASTETPDFIFNYSDSDSLNSELAEWYTYSEEPEFVWNAKAFKNTLYRENCKQAIVF